MTISSKYESGSRPRLQGDEILLLLDDTHVTLV